MNWLGSGLVGVIGVGLSGRLPFAPGLGRDGFDGFSCPGGCLRGRAFFCACRRLRRGAVRFPDFHDKPPAERGDQAGYLAEAGHARVALDFRGPALVHAEEFSCLFLRERAAPPQCAKHRAQPHGCVHWIIHAHGLPRVCGKCKILF